MSSAYSYIHGKLPKTWIHFDTHGSSYGGFHLYLSELAFINQFYFMLTRLVRPSLANDYFRNHFAISSKYFGMVCPKIQQT